MASGDRSPLLSDGNVTEANSPFPEELARLEAQTLAVLDLVVAQMDRALESINYQDVELAGMVVVGDDDIDGRYLEVHHGVLALLVGQTPSAEDLRLAAALLHIVRCIERIGDQCVNMAKLVPLSGYEAPKDATVLEQVERMGKYARQEIVQAQEAFRTRHVQLAKDLARQDAIVDRLNRQIFRRAVDVGDDPEVREWAMFMTLVARCLERIGDNAVDIAEQTVFTVTGLFQEFRRIDIGAAGSGC